MRLSHLALPSLFVLSCAGLTGCAGFKDAAPLPNATALINPGPVAGSDFGGHSPIAGARVFVLQAVANQYGYGAKAVSRLNTADAGVATDYTGSPTTNPTYGMAYLTSGADGSYIITGDYNCSTGDPVYMYDSGGSSTGAAATISSLSQVTLASDPSDSNYQIATITVSASTPENFVPGEPVTLFDFPVGVSEGSSVLASPLTSTQFAITLPSSLGYPNGTFTTAQFGTSATVTGYSGNNPQITNIAMMGLCPGTANEFADTLKYVYVNEVSTAAMAEAMAGFKNATATGVTQSAANIGAPTTNLLGLQNAALNANQLYDVQGGNQAGGTNGGGDSHVARSITPAGNGIVPQPVLDTLGNILAACVDSANTYNPYGLTPLGTQSSACSTLFGDASTNGGAAGGTAATDTAIAAFNIAHLPAGAAGTTFMSDLFGLQGASYPFGANLTAQPNDFSVAVQYPLSSTAFPTVANPALNRPGSVAIDGSGDVWMNSNVNKTVFELSSLGVLKYQSPAASGYNYGGVSVDPTGNVWVGTDTSTGPETEFMVTTSSSGVQTVVPTTYNGPFTGGFYDALATVTDATGNVYIGAAPSASSTQWELTTISSSGTPSVLNAAPVTNGYVIAHAAVDSGNYVWLTTENGSEVGRYSESSGAPLFLVTATDASGNSTGLLDPEGAAVDAGNNLWVANQHFGQSGGLLMRISSAGVTHTYNGGTQVNPYGVAVDGLDHIWVTNRCVFGCTTSGTTGPFSSILEFDSSGNVISPANNYTLGGQVSHPLNIAVDGSGVIWLTSYDSSMVGEVFGAGAPTATPLSTASGAGALGARP